MSGPVPLSPGDLALAASLLLVNAGLSAWLRLGLERRLLVATLRTVVQLSLLGFVLTPVFAWRRPEAVLALGLVMIALAAREAVARVSLRYTGMLGVSFGSLLLAGSVSTLLATVVVIDVDAWWRPQYFIPLLGMILGNALTGVSLGLDRVLTTYAREQARVESLLALGATRWEAARPVVAEALTVSMVPILNSMSAVGLVTIPGMMTGQILGGTDPGQAARYQIMIMFLIAGAVAMGAAGSVLGSTWALFDDAHRLRSDRLQPRRRPA